MRTNSGAAVADRIAAEVDEMLALLAQFPRLGRPRSDLTSGPMLFFPFHSWFIVYMPAVSPLAIVRVVSAWRDLKCQL